MNTWHFISSHLEFQIPCMLMVVVESIGSSPGRQGFKMVVAQNGNMTGSIGGGIMEHKLVLLVQQILEEKEKAVTVKKQVHNKLSLENQSGMICSGEQTIALVPLYPEHTTAIKEIVEHVELKNKSCLQLSPQGLVLLQNANQDSSRSYSFNTNTDWLYTERLHIQKIIHIIGSGHVGLALSKQMRLLNFHVIVYDDRPELNTLQVNDSAHEKKIVEYAEIGHHIPEGRHHHVVIMTFGYRDDKVVLKALYQKQLGYIGMMGSKEKIRQLREELASEGISQDDVKHVYTPIGLAIGSKTPEEIAVSIAAEIVRVGKNIET